MFKVLKTHPRVVATRAAVDATRARQQAASKPLFNPELELDAERAETDSAFLGLSQTIDWADMRSAQAMVSGFDREAVQLFWYTVERSDEALEKNISDMDLRTFQDWSVRLNPAHSAPWPQWSLVN